MALLQPTSAQVAAGAVLRPQTLAMVLVVAAVALWPVAVVVAVAVLEVPVQLLPVRLRRQEA